jgi:hypothetical protein
VWRSRERLRSNLALERCPQAMRVRIAYR